MSDARGLAAEALAMASGTEIFSKCRQFQQSRVPTE